MRNLLYFLMRTAHVFLFLFLGGVCIYFIYKSSSYKQWALNAFTKEISAPMLNVKSSIEQYFRLQEDNQILINENSELLKMVFNVDLKQKNAYQLKEDSLLFSYCSANVLNNSVNKEDNVLIINKGERVGLSTDMGVISPQGIVGIITDVSPNFAIVKSVLNTEFTIAAKIKRTGETGVLEWNGKNYKYAQLSDLTSVEDIKKGDTLVTQYSMIFPANYPIGIIEENSSEQAISGYHIVQVRLLNDFNKLNYVYVVKNNYSEELKILQKGADNE